MSPKKNQNIFRKNKTVSLRVTFWLLPNCWRLNQITKIGKSINV